MSTTEAPTLQNRRLRIRNARTNPSTLPPSSSSSGYYANANTNRFEGGSPGSVSVDRKSSFLEGDGWETDDQGDGEGEGEEEVDRKRRNRVSSSSLLSDGSTLVGGELDDGVAGGYKEDEDKDTTATTTTGGGGGIGRRSSNRRSPSPLLSPMGPVRAMTSPIPVRPMSMISTPSPYNYASTAHRRNRSNGGVGSGDSPGSSARYIDYLERQIADTVSQLQSYTSPSEGTSHAVKMRKLMAETRLLHSELTDWENKFSARVKEEVNARATIDKSLRVKIKNLEVKLEEAEYRYRTVEVDLEEARAKISDLKGVEEENRTLEFRIEALSELLADSTRLAQGVGVGRNGCSSAGSSGPGSIVFPKRCSSLGSSSSAPLSASLSRAQSRGAPAASTTGGKNTPVESRSRRASGEGSTCALEDYGITDPIEAVLCSMSELAATEGVEEGGGEFEYADEFDETGSNPNTALVRTSPHHPPPAVLRNRRMRRFPSGSSAPKTLILPSAAVVTATTTTTTSPTLPTIRSFFNTPISDPASVIFSPPLSRSPSSSSTSSCCAPLSQISSSQKIPTPQTSLFAELARAQDSSSSDSEEDFPQDLLDPSAYDNTSAITEALTNPTPLVVKAISKVGESYISPQGTFLNAKRKAMDILGGVVGNRVSRHHHHHHHFLHTPPVAIPLRRRSSSSSSSEKKKQGEKCHCSCHTPPPLPTTTAVTKRARSISAPLSFPQPVEEAVEHVWLWVRFMVALVVALGVAVREGPGVVVAVDGVGGIASRSRGGSSAGEGGFDGVGEEERCFAIRRLQEQQGGTAAEMRGRRRRGLGWGEERVRVWERMGGGDR
ncbi:hypothetical protein L873DRAFT_1833907 [Choiromyces venosus 120613-1]|uniref:Uncharacterized protein n=1 Tax=Choiromyces venosus 120613-1 TaxID=1336337 RepID=A0A3N4JXP3_9PEZI|nr:hypothetical protein L873DRAFT_1833907 [Choiromyces venosus 120613-1]